MTTQIVTQDPYGKRFLEVYSLSTACELKENIMNNYLDSLTNCLSLNLDTNTLPLLLWK